MCSYSFGFGIFDICYVFHMTWERPLGTLRTCVSSQLCIDGFVHMGGLADDQGEGVALTFGHECLLYLKFCAPLADTPYTESHRRMTQAQYVI
ncbi:hypothetical protein OWV82_010714 [Melia azedarach]|uniref:Uncharacterized protein n=1 Tax=Melia azedarach TaxID=155640 RepID=A0ACC1Y624_MELAZ|nr:hypothetical protein OWV82_010714 [Melia azedarach]